jgi:hypothetical protein
MRNTSIMVSLELLTRDSAGHFYKARAPFARSAGEKNDNLLKKKIVTRDHFLISF